MQALRITWFCLIGLLLAGYVILDGYDLGVGFWYLLARSSEERRALMGSILPYWDGNEVWLLTGGGAVFAAFPHVYATVFSGLYLAMMLVLFALIFGRSGCVQASIRVGALAKALGCGVRAREHRSRPAFRGRGGKYPSRAAIGRFDELHRHVLHAAEPVFAVNRSHRPCDVRDARRALGNHQTGGELARRSLRWAVQSGIAFCLLLSISAIATAQGYGGSMAGFYDHPALWLAPVLMLASAATALGLAASGQASCLCGILPGNGNGHRIDGGRAVSEYGPLVG